MTELPFWPNIRVGVKAAKAPGACQSSIEVLSIPMARHLIKMVKSKACKARVLVEFQNVWDRELSHLTVEQLIAQDIQIARDRVPYGEFHIQLRDRNLILPVNITYEIYEMFDYVSEFSRVYLERRYDYRISDADVDEVCNQWIRTWRLDENDRPVRPTIIRTPHPGSRLDGQPATPPMQRVNPEEFMNNAFDVPPPAYSPPRNYPAGPAGLLPTGQNQNDPSLSSEDQDAEPTSVFDRDTATLAEVIELIFGPGNVHTQDIFNLPERWALRPQDRRVEDAAETILDETQFQPELVPLRSPAMTSFSDSKDDASDKENEDPNQNQENTAAMSPQRNVDVRIRRVFLELGLGQESILLTIRLSNGEPFQRPYFNRLAEQTDQAASLTEITTATNAEDENASPISMEYMARWSPEPFSARVTEASRRILELLRGDPLLREVHTVELAIIRPTSTGAEDNSQPSDLLREPDVWPDVANSILSSPLYRSPRRQPTELLSPLLLGSPLVSQDRGNVQIDESLEALERPTTQDSVSPILNDDNLPSYGFTEVQYFGDYPVVVVAPPLRFPTPEPYTSDGNGDSEAETIIDEEAAEED